MSESVFEFRRFEEPEIEFGNGGKTTSVKRGLIEYGPRLNDAEHHQVNVGVIGDRDSIQRLLKLFQDMHLGIHPGGDVDPGNVPFPGLGQDSELKFSIHEKDLWRRYISGIDIRGLTNQGTTREKMEYFLELVESDIELLQRLDPQPSVIVVCLPEKVVNECTPEEGESSDIRADGSDLRNRIKLLGMQYQMPTQLIKPDTLNTNSDKKLASRAWNIGVGLLYKSQRGHPWKTKDLDPETCYAGISFYKERESDDNVLRAALAHVLIQGEHLILQSDPMEDTSEDENGQPHLSRAGAKSVVEQILNYYELQKETIPKRLVLHKSSDFWEDEREGFLDAAEEAGVRWNDYVRIRDRTNIRVFPQRQYPVIRGSCLSIPDDDLHYLYTTGYVPEVATYEGSGIPEPIEVKPDEVCRTPPKELLEEVLFFTKLDWNTSDFAVKMPVTLRVSRKVGRVLSEVDTAGLNDVKAQYFYYM